MAHARAAELGPMQQHVTILGILFLVFGLFGLLMFFLMSAFIGLAFIPFIGMGGMPEGFFFGIMGLFVLAFVLAVVLAGVGLLQGKPWGRPLGFVAGALSLLNFPVGTALGVYAFWVLTRPEVERTFAA